MVMERGVTSLFVKHNAGISRMVFVNLIHGSEAQLAEKLTLK